jgi:hypothetical protein
MPDRVAWGPVAPQRRQLTTPGSEAVGIIGEWAFGSRIGGISRRYLTRWAAYPEYRAALKRHMATPKEARDLFHE